jgi:glyoxylase-like metal-dependent hydrolase (beta-lactamase superfamily II)
MPKEPRAVLDAIFAFPPNRETLGGTAYFIVGKNANFLIDCPPWNEVTQEFIQVSGGVKSLLITHREAIGKAKEIQEFTQCEIVIQEQIAYLLPNLSLTCFTEELTIPAGDPRGEIAPNLTLIWTPGHCPGSTCVYYSAHGGVLFTGRHLLPNQQGEPMPLRVFKTFHWPRQLRSLQHLQQRFTSDKLTYLCPGANTGFLRGQGTIDRAGDRLSRLDITALSAVSPLL